MRRSLGVCYYPEHWDEAVWAEDARRMAELGLSWVRIGEFAWSRFEPSPGRLAFDWLDRAMDVLGAAGLRVVLGTPTATPPRWLVDRMPDMLPVDRLENPRRFGSCRHYDFSHEGYREECRRIVRLLAERYGRHPSLGAWKTDNEYACHDTVLSYSEPARQAFRAWLAQRHQSPEAMNRAHGNVFWSMEIADWAQVDLPNLTVTEANPSLSPASRRLASDMVVEFNRLQVEEIRRHSNARSSTTTWAASPSSTTSPWARTSTSRAGTATPSASCRTDWRTRPSGRAVSSVRATPTARPSTTTSTVRWEAGVRAAAGRWWVMEQQSGPVNWAPFNPAPPPGMVRLWTWEAFAHGAEVVSYFRWRQLPHAQEQMHAGLLRPDSAPAPAFHEAGEVARELAGLESIDPVQTPVALVFDYESAWVWGVQPQGRDFDFFRLTFAAYRAFRRAGLSVDILPPDTADLSGYKVVLAPGLMRLSDPLRAALGRFDGIALAGPRTDSKTEELSIPVPLGPDLPGCDISVVLAESLPPRRRGLSGGRRPLPPLVRAPRRQRSGPAPQRRGAARADGRPPPLSRRLAG